MNSRTLPLILAAGLAALVLGVFYPVGEFEFLNYDDPGHVSENPWVGQGLTPESLSKAFTARDTNLWHPLTWISHALDVELLGLEPGRHHLVNLCLHLGNVLLLFLFFYVATGRAVAAFFVAAIFAVHPIQVESVAWISDRKGLLSSFFWLVGLLAYGRYQRRRSICDYLMVTVAFGAALMAKPTAVMFPVSLLLVDLWPLCRTKLSGPGREFWRSASRLIWEKIPWFLMAAVFAIITILIQSRGTHAAYLAEDPLLMRLAAAVLAYGDRVWHLIWPAGLIPDYPDPESIPVVGLSVLVLIGAAVTAASFIYSRRAPWLLFGWLWFLALMAPMSGIVDLGRVFTADRYVYLPMVGIAVMFVFSLDRAAVAAGKWGRLGLCFAGLIAVLMMALGSRKQVGHWRNSETLFRYTLTVNPKSQIALTNLGQRLQQKGNVQEAEVLYGQLIKHHPNYHLGYHNLGTILAGQRRHGEAEACFRSAIRNHPNHVPSLLALTAALAHQGRLEDAREYLERVLEIDPGNEVAGRRLEDLIR